MAGELFSATDEPHFVTLVSEQLAKGAATRRGMSEKQYVSLARERWGACESDSVYQIKLIVDPLTQPELAEGAPSPLLEAGEPFLVLIARIDSRGQLIDAEAGYQPPSLPGVVLTHLPFGSPSGGETPRPDQPAEYLVAFLDVLGFESLLEDIGLASLAERYQRLLAGALVPQSGARPWSKAITEVGDAPVVGLMWSPIQATYFSDSLMLWSHYHPGHVHDFLDRCARVFCDALSQGLPLRGAISIGEAILDKESGTFLGKPLVEAVRLESRFNWIGIALAASWRSKQRRIPIPPDRVQIYEPPRKGDAATLHSGLVLDWPRIWREEHGDDDQYPYVLAPKPELPAEVRTKYDAALAFFEHSRINRDWDVPHGMKRVRVADLVDGSPGAPSSGDSSARGGRVRGE